MSARAIAPSPSPADLRDPSIDALDQAIATLAARLNAGTHDLLVLIRRFDERGGWLRWGFESCAEWLHWRCDLSMSACREKVRVAHALKVLPEIALAFAEGRLSYSKVRALTRVAGPADESALLEFALHTTAARVEERCRELRCGTAASTDDAWQSHARRALSLRRDSARGTVTITVELPLETGELVDKALDRALEQMMHEGIDGTTDAKAVGAPYSAGESWARQRADAFVEMAMSYLNGSRPDTPGSSGMAEHHQLVVHVDHSALTEGRGRAGLPIETVRRIGCDSDRVVLVEDERGEPLSICRKRCRSRVIGWRT